MSITEKSYDELEKAKFYLGEMRSAKSLVEFEDAWKHYLSRLERVWYKFIAAHKGHRKWDGWGGSHIRTKKADPLLKYLTNARGADEHSICEIMAVNPGTMAIKSIGDSLYIKEMTFSSKKGLFIDSPDSFEIQFTPARITLLPITYKGVVFGIPTSHLGNPVDPNDIIVIAELGIAYYEKMLEDSKIVFI